MSRSSTAAELTAEAHALLAKGHALLAEAARLDSQAPAANDNTKPSWIPSAQCPTGNRDGLRLARTGAVESAKVGRKVLLRRASLAAYLQRHRRDADAPPPVGDEDLFGAVTR